MRYSILSCLCITIMTYASNQPPVPGYAPITIDPERIQLIGIKIEKIEQRDLEKKIRTVGIVEVDERKIAHIRTKISGWIEQLFVNFTGMSVKKGDPLFSIYSQELLATQEEYLLALKDLERPLQGRFAQELKKASEELLSSSRRRLELWDISEQQIHELELTKKPTKTLTLYSPVNGIVLNKNAFIGMSVAPDTELFTIADLSHVWILADIYEDNISFIKTRQKAHIALPALPEHVLSAEVQFINYVVESGTRTTKIRFECDNDTFYLKPGMYATVEMTIPLGKKLALPDEALIDTGKKKIVFVAQQNGHFEPRDVRLGVKAGDYYEILSGLAEGEDVVTSSQFLLDSESRIKALTGTDKKEHHA